MSAEHGRRSSAPWWRRRWWMPTFSLLLGALMFAAFAIGGRAGDGARAFMVMAVVGAVFLLGSRSETLQGLGGPGRDERWVFIDMRANAATGLVLVAAVLVLWLYEIADGQNGSPYGQLAALAGITYILAVAWLRRRS